MCWGTEKESIILYRKYLYYGSNNAIIHDSNEICVDNEYELFYWNMKWISLGEKLAVDNKLHYDDVPKGALLWLKIILKEKKSGFLHTRTGNKFGGRDGK